MTVFNDRAAAASGLDADLNTKKTSRTPELSRESCHWTALNASTGPISALEYSEEWRKHAALHRPGNSRVSSSRLQSS